MKLNGIRKLRGKLKNLIKRQKIKPIEKLVRGPAIETFNIPHFLSLRLNELIGTGFAQAKIGPWPLVNIIKKSGKMTDPIGSKCFKGFKESRPASLAVGSPKAKAALP